jgi:hypothetical protein
LKPFGTQTGVHIMKKWRIGTALLILSLLAIPLVGSGCSGGSVTNPYELSNFTRLDIQNAFDVQIVQSGTYSITITSSESLLDYLSVVQEGEAVIIKLHPNHPFTDFVLMKKVLKAKITMPVLSSLSLSGACKCSVTGFESTSTLDLNVSGASELKLNGIETGDANIIISGDSGITGKLTAVNTKFDVSGASRADIDGTGEDVQLNASGASKVDLEGFINQTATITLSGSSQTTIDTREHLDFSLSGASSLFFLSNPITGKTEVLGASTVKHK